jgi:pimeloyl-ACP methyl ester carboxylesterase
MKAHVFRCIVERQRNGRRLWALLLMFTLSFACAARGAGQYVKVDYPASTAPGELQVAVTYTIWIPDGVDRLRGIIVHQHGAGTTASIEGSTAAYDLHWQALAKKWDCALLGPSYHVLNEKIDLSPGGSELWFDPRKGSERTFLRALRDLASQSGHPELESVPWALWGHSGGGIWADVMASLHPDRVAVAWLRSGSAAMFRPRPEFPALQVPSAVYGIPMMCNPGAKEQMRGPWIGTLATFQEYRAKGAPIGFAPDPRTGHECGDSRYLAIPYFDACLAMRLPEKGSKDAALRPIDVSKGWLAPLMGIDAQPASTFKGDPNVAVWLPNEAVARAWADYVKTGAVRDTTPPPAPFDVKVTASDRGAEVRWSADADFESGIGSFIVLRDGRELARVPQTPVGKFGRALFQSMTYHDTPAQPMPEMRYVDASVKPGEEHTYSVIEVNSVGLESQPAPRSTQPTTEARASTDQSHRSGASAYVPFEGEATQWHAGFARYDYIMDDRTLAIRPFNAPEGERFGVGAPPAGERRCIVIVPKHPAPGSPWSWRGCYWDHQPQTEVELLRRGFHVVFITPDPGKPWDAWYAYLTEQHKLSRKPAFIGMSKGGVNEYDWATANPDKVSCIYADNPAIRPEAFARLPDLASNDIPLLNICGSEDFLLHRNTLPIEERYHELGGRITVMIKDGTAHHPHSLEDAKPIADWIVEHTKPEPNSGGARPDFVDDSYARSYYYSLENTYVHLAKEQTYATCRGPGFVPCYDRYELRTGSQWGVGGMVVIAPNTAAKGKPWVFRANLPGREALVDQAMLAKGYYIVVPPLTAQSGPVREQWDAVYKLLTEHGFSKTAVMEGAGTSAGEAYAWALEDPSRVSCIVGENPVLRSLMMKKPLLDRLNSLAAAHVALIDECGSKDPWLDDQTRAIEKRYKSAGGEVAVIVREGTGHFLPAERDVTDVVDFVVKHVR